MYTNNDEQRIMQRTAREFAEREIAPALKAQMEKGQPYDFCLGIWPKVAEAGFVGISTTEEMGGLGLGVTTELLVMEAFTYYGGGPVATNIDAHNLALRTLEFNGSDYLKEKYGEKGATGEIVFAAAITDPAGSMNFPEWSITVTHDGDYDIINGTKFFTTNMIAADVYAIYVNDYENGYPMGCYFIDKDTEGFEIGNRESFGTSGTNTGTITLKNVRVPKENKIPSADLANAEWLALGYLDAAAIFSARTRKVLDLTEAYVKQRTRNGKPMASMQAVAHRMANMNMLYEQARSIMYTAARLWDEGRPDLKLHSMAKIATSDAFSTISHDCTVLHGAYGSAPENGIIQFHISAPASQCGECPNDFHRDLIAKYMGIELDTHLA